MRADDFWGWVFLIFGFCNLLFDGDQSFGWGAVMLAKLCWMSSDIKDLEDNIDKWVGKYP